MHTHLVGIGGAGMSPMAAILLQRGESVSGSDMQATPITADLAARGAVVVQGHRPEHVNGADRVVISSAVPADNPELVEARRRGLPVLKAAELLGEIMRDRVGLCVAGTHGKTTTTALLALALREAGLDPGFVIGGVPQDLPTSGHWGTGPHFVAEADEYDRRFLALTPQVAVITSLDADHLDVYGTMDALQDAFAAFAARVPADGYVVGCGDEARVLALHQRPELRGTWVTYGLGPGHDWSATNMTPNDAGGHDFAVSGAGEFRLQVPGRHNVANATAVVAVAGLLGVDMDAVRRALAGFRGVQRRFEVLGEVNGVPVIDDYAHHPAEIRATLAAARQRYPGRRLVAVHQPHTYTRTRALLTEFASALAQADVVMLTPIYAARERDTLGVSSADLAAAMDRVILTDSLDEAAARVLELLRPSDVLITLGAGDVNRIAYSVIRGYWPEVNDGRSSSS
ncbi:MAG: UDP-N-acetylmuramate--L-alanine ligase [Chloroflexi bacterium]|nr:UDP-N-acetylmuramate--L-alanine ligase [Chloroflexota bacterium]MBU1751626.1 UDP-N-acetylmuramate--L-alanine ligase [Chloroflexota bacterium]